MRRPRRAAALTGAAGACGLLLLACPAQTYVPGDVVVGTFRFNDVTLYQDDCHFAEEAPDGGLVMKSFVATISYTSGSGPGARHAYFNSGATQLDGTLQTGDGTFVVKSRADIERDLPLPCARDGGVCHGTLSETISGRLLTADQAGTAGCASVPSDDAGSALDPTSDGGVPEVRLVCGYITDEFKPPPDGGCSSCETCLVVYSISGERQ